MSPTELACGFCGKRLPLARQASALTALAGQVHLCRHCGAAYLVASDSANPRALMSNALHLPGPRLQLSTSPSLAEIDGRALFLVCGWDPDEMLSTVRVAQILELHRVTVQQHVRQGRFPGAQLSPAATHGQRGYWSIPRGALPEYVRGKGKAAGDSLAARVNVRP